MHLVLNGPHSWVSWSRRAKPCIFQSILHEGSEVMQWIIDLTISMSNGILLQDFNNYHKDSDDAISDWMARASR